MLEFLLKKAIYKAAVIEKGEEWADKYIDPFKLGLKDCLNDFKLTLFVSFNDSNEFLGRSIIEPLALLNRKYKLNMINTCLRFSCKSKVFGIRVF